MSSVGTLFGWTRGVPRKRGTKEWVHHATIVDHSVRRKKSFCLLLATDTVEVLVHGENLLFQVNTKQELNGLCSLGAAGGGNVSSDFQ